MDNMNRTELAFCRGVRDVEEMGWEGEEEVGRQQGCLVAWPGFSPGCVRVLWEQLLWCLCHGGTKTPPKAVP